ncbi:MAG TPA: bifunctional diaminohydroxyphosphoribosylaminopyrimidine deaminase/5-amino-6-(5-phosphoribosylamino)uracil reductase RibD [Acidothermaceae bacterium]|nr:bifunctional diaminohydroxyphosphoribosylaminopyrimidine deaminase/5-amino-6-(5-phosphoribosylamino)uracil reductase RibD [Acidothermaceae bacterium]
MPEPDAAMMRRAIELAERGLGSTSPNPIVGCVIVGVDGTVVGEGFHARAGGPHAEVVAIRDADGLARGATAFVTLEPCRHTGRTPPCTQALIDAGVARVVFAVADPDPLAGHGADDLRAAGVDVEAGLLHDEAARSNVAWLHRTHTGRPYVTWKYAATLDGRVAAADGTSRWITGEAARHDVHLLRSRSDAIVVGTGTALADDPRLDVRLPGMVIAKPPLRVVVGNRPLPAATRLLDDSAPTLVIADHDPASVLKLLAERDVVSVLLEGGPTLAGAFVAAGLVDRVVAYLAPSLLGAGLPALGDAGIETLAAALKLRIDAVDLVGDDVRVTATTLSATTSKRSE